MEEIDELFEITSFITNKTFVIKFNSLNLKLTDLKILKFFTDFEKAIQALYDERIKSACFLFVLNEIFIPTNFKFLTDFANVLKKHNVIILEKISFSIIQNDSNIFKLFFNVFKMYYEPKKSLYLCNDNEQTDLCLNNEEERKNIPNILAMLQNS